MVEFEERAPDENRTSFVTRLTRFNLREKRSIMFAYDIAKFSHGHKNQMRDSGVRYFEHPRSVALILLDECNIKDPATVKAALLHDVLEDTSMFGNAHFETHRELIKVARYRLTKSFDKETAGIVIDVSKPNGIDLQRLTRDERDDMYHKNLEKAGAKSLLVKMADVLHNNRTLESTILEKQHRRVKETEDIYFQLFKRVILRHYPAEGSYLLMQIELAIDKIRRSWKE